MRLEGSRALVTGAANGIGRAVARRFAQEGASLSLVDRDADGLASLASELGDSVVASEVADVADEAAMRAVAAGVEDLWGGLDVAVLNAGIVGPVATIDALPLEAFDRVMAVNVRGVWLGLATLMPLMRAAGGSIVVTSSTGGLRGAAGMGAYTASKHAVLGLVKTAALEGARYGIRVNAVCPAPIDTAMMEAIAERTKPDDPGAVRTGTEARIPLRRYGTPDEVASLMLYLASAEAAFVTGGAHLIDGGTMAGQVR